MFFLACSLSPPCLDEGVTHGRHLASSKEGLAILGLACNHHIHLRRGCGSIQDEARRLNPLLGRLFLLFSLSFFLLGHINAMATDSAAMSEYNNVVFHHVPNALAPGLLAALCVYAYCLGLVSWELILNGRHDVRLLRRPGWREPVKLANRFCYYACRYGALTFLLMTAVYMTTPGIDCGVYARVLNVLWILPLIFVDFLFISRTLALYGWDTALTAVLGTLYIIYVGLCCYSVILFGDGYQIPASDFCAYVTRSKSDQPHAGIFIAYWTVTIFLDTLVRCRESE